MLRNRIIPTLLLHDECLVKTRNFSDFVYIGDPCNTVRIFNELEVDELFFLDIRASKNGNPPNYTLLKDISGECFMPLGYGGGIQTLEQARRIFKLGFEKVVINTAARSRSQLINELSDEFGSQAVVASIDFSRDFLGRYRVYDHVLGQRINDEPVELAIRLANAGAGEILLTNVDKEGTWTGFDCEVVKSVSSAVRIPVIAHGGAGASEHITQAMDTGRASAVALGSMVVFQKKGMGVLINYDSGEMESLTCS